MKIKTIEDKINSEEVEYISQLNDEINKRIKIQINENQNIVDRETLDNQMLLEKISNAQLELAQEIIDQWKNEQLKDIRTDPNKYTS